MDLDVAVDRVDVNLEHVGPAICPECGKEVPLHDHSALREWRHLDTMQCATFVKARVPRGKCPDHGVKQTKTPWADPHSHFTYGYEEWLIKVLELTKSQIRTARLLRTSPHHVHEVMKRAVLRGLALRKLNEIAHLSIDEKSFQRGRKFGTVLCDVQGKRIIEVTPGRNEAAAVQAFASVPVPGKVLTVSMDMSESYRNGTQGTFPKADIVHDRFHIAMMLSKAVDQVRRAETKKNPVLKNSRYLWLTNPENRSENQNKAFQDLMSVELKTSKAWALKEVFKGFFQHDEIQEAANFFNCWLSEVDRANLQPLSKVAQTLDKNHQGILNYIKWKITNGYAEAINGLIQEIKTIARGFRRFDNFRIAILFFLGRLELKPHKLP